MRFGRDMHNELVIAPAKDGEGVAQDRIAVLVHEYSPGSGAKRWPSFHIDWDNASQVEKLSSAHRGKGSGSDTYTLVIVPSDWAENIAGQFINERDFVGQTVAYKQGFMAVNREKEVRVEVFTPKERFSTPCPSLGSLGDMFAKLGL